MFFFITFVPFYCRIFRSLLFNTFVCLRGAEVLGDEEDWVVIGEIRWRNFSGKLVKVLGRHLGKDNKINVFMRFAVLRHFLRKINFSKRLRVQARPLPINQLKSDLNKFFFAIFYLFFLPIL